MEEKKELLEKELKEEELDTVVGGRWMVTIDYRCNACGHTWTNRGTASKCPSCGSTNISRD